MKKAKILHVENSCWDIYKFRTPFLEAMKEMGMEVILAAPLDEYFGRIDEKLYDEFVEIRNLKAQSIAPLRDLRYLLELKKLLQRVSPDLTLFFTIKPGIYGGIASQWTRTPAMVFLTGLGYTFYNGTILRRIVTTLSKLAYRRIEKLVVLNEDDKARLTELKIVKPEKIFIQPAEGVDVDHFSPLPKTIHNGKFIFLFIGRLIATKGLRELVEAVKILKTERDDFECWIVGDQSFSNPSVISRREVHSWVTKQYVRYFGATDDVRQYIRNADVVVLPSHGEGKPRVLQEAMAMAKPVITTSTSGCRELVNHHESGLLVPPCKPYALTEAMRYMVELPGAKLEAMGCKGQQIVLERYATEVTKRHFAKLLNESIPFMAQLTGRQKVLVY